MSKKRNPAAVLQALGQVLLKYPEFRVGQAIVNALPARFKNDAFYIEDDELAACLQALEVVERLRESYKFPADVGDRPPFEYGLALDEIDALREERDRLRGALEKAKGPIAIAASYADAPEVSVGLRVHARDCARILPEINAAIAKARGEG